MDHIREAILEGLRRGFGLDGAERSKPIHSAVKSSTSIKPLKAGSGLHITEKSGTFFATLPTGETKSRVRRRDLVRMLAKLGYSAT